VWREIGQENLPTRIAEVGGANIGQEYRLNLRGHIMMVEGGSIIDADGRVVRTVELVCPIDDIAKEHAKSLGYNVQLWGHTRQIAKMSQQPKQEPKSRSRLERSASTSPRSRRAAGHGIRDCLADFALHISMAAVGSEAAR
jgi:hypothetical protein